MKVKAQIEDVIRRERGDYLVKFIAGSISAHVVVGNLGDVWRAIKDMVAIKTWRAEEPDVLAHELVGQVREIEVPVGRV